MNRFFILFSCCIPVKGYKRSTLCDIQRDSYMYIPNKFCDFLLQCSGLVDFDLLHHIDHIEKQSLTIWLDKLANKEFGFYTDDESDLNSFLPIDLKYEEPKPISNAIIDVCEEYEQNFSAIFTQLDELLCEAIELRIFHEINPQKLSDILFLTQGTSIRTIEIVIKYGEEYDEPTIISFFKENARLSKITLHTSDNNRIIDDNNYLIMYIEDAIDSESHCGIVDSDFFKLNLQLFTESLNKNTCLNKKISVDKYGYVKNCPSMAKHFGHTRDVKLKDVLLDVNFTRTWDISKDQIEICKVCEFRHMCTDCRAYTQDSNLFNKPSKCSYDPYKAIWN